MQYHKPSEAMITLHRCLKSKSVKQEAQHGQRRSKNLMHVLEESQYWRFSAHLAEGRLQYLS